MNENMLSNFKFVLCSPDAAAAQTDLDGSVIDMAQDEGYDGICLVAMIGDVADTSVLNLRLMGSAAADGSAPSVENETGTFTAGAATADDKVMILDTRCPANRYVFSRFIRGTANAAVNAVLAILYKPRKLPVTQNANVIKSLYDWVLGT